MTKQKTIGDPVSFKVKIAHLNVLTAKYLCFRRPSTKLDEFTTDVKSLDNPQMKATSAATDADDACDHCSDDKPENNSK
uniref:Uncharacterized protein n=1 Tax=Romanomermis culicivorax TaxID=13658 RepID=A0A915K789_ROMCU